MKRIISSANIIILANNHNPAIPTKDWLLTKSVFSKEPTNFINTVLLSVFESEEYVLEINEKRLSLIVKKPEDIKIDELINIVKKYINALPETPYSAIGFNIHWRCIRSNSEENIISDLQKRFCKNQDTIAKIIGTKEFKYGLSFIFIENDIQISVNIVPDKVKEEFDVRLNFHKDILSNTKPFYLIEEFINNLNNHISQAEQLVNNLFKGSDHE